MKESSSIWYIVALLNHLSYLSDSREHGKGGVLGGGGGGGRGGPLRFGLAHRLSDNEPLLKALKE